MIFNIVISIFLGISSGASLIEKIQSDINLIVPGVGSEKIILKEESGVIISAKGYPDSVSEFEETKEFFHHVFGIDSKLKILFNKIYYYEKQKSVFFIHDNIITAIAGMTNNRITSDAIDLKKGIEYFIFGYGNNNLTVLAKSNDKNRDKIYLYPEDGIAVFDDGNDDIIDLYIVFPVVKHE